MIRQFSRHLLFRLMVVIGMGFLMSCMPSSPTKQGTKTITLYGFSIMKEPLEKAIFPAFAEKWKREHGEDVSFSSSFAGSETVTNQILQGAPAEVAILSIERDVERLSAGGFVTQNWKASPHNGIVNKTPFVILVRKGNPKGIKDFADLGKPGIQIIHPDPISSGGAQWSILAIYGSILKKTEKEQGSMNTGQALETLQAVWKNVIATPTSAREARTQFESGFGDALITYELEGLSMKDAGSPVEMVIPQSTIYSEHPAVVLDKNVTGDKRVLVEEFLKYLWSDEAQQAFVKYHFRSVTNESFNDANKGLAKIEMPFTVELFGGWDRAYPEIIENIFKGKVLKK